MAMTKRAKTGKLEQVIDEKGKEATLSELNMQWSDVVIKDILVVPTSAPHSIDVDLDNDEEEDYIAPTV